MLALGASHFVFRAGTRFYDADVGMCRAQMGLEPPRAGLREAPRSRISAGRLRMSSQLRAFPTGSPGLGAGSWDLQGGVRAGEPEELGLAGSRSLIPGKQDLGRGFIPSVSCPSDALGLE